MRWSIRSIFDWRLWVAAALGTGIILELSLRLLLDFPLYGADNEVGYFVLPDQHGSYLGVNDWSFNAQGMGVSEDYRPGAGMDVLLIGDSLVFGGNPVDQAERLGPLIEQRTGWETWPISAGSWALQNELAYLARYPEAVGTADAIVFVVNSKDFAKPSSWASQYTHPLAKPQIYLLYLFGKLLPGDQARSPERLTVHPWPNLAGKWRDFVRQSKAPVVVVAYPHLPEVGGDCEWLPAWMAQGSRTACYGSDGTVRVSSYLDDIHPDTEGRRALAAFIEEQVKSVMQSRWGLKRGFVDQHPSRREPSSRRTE